MAGKSGKTGRREWKMEVSRERLCADQKKGQEKLAKNEHKRELNRNIEEKESLEGKLHKEANECEIFMEI